MVRQPRHKQVLIKHGNMKFNLNKKSDHNKRRLNVNLLCTRIKLQEKKTGVLIMALHSAYIKENQVDLEVLISRGCAFFRLTGHEGIWLT